MTTTRIVARWIAPALLTLLGLTACGGGGPASPPVIVLSAHPGIGSADASPADAVVLHLASAPGIGRYLIANGRALYMYPPDHRRAVTCTAKRACAAAWPPLFIPSGERVRAGAGVSASLIGSVRGDGGTVATYNKWPLYFYIGDRKPGQVSGQGQGFDWYVISADGIPIHRNLS